MKALFGWLLLLVLTVSSCTSRSKAKAQNQAAFKAGQLQALATMTQQAPVISFRGDVKNSVVPWTEDLTLSAALLAAEYNGLWDPHSISIVRQGQVIRVNPKRLLSGSEDPPLEPGDVVEIRR